MFYIDIFLKIEYLKRGHLICSIIIYSGNMACKTHTGKTTICLVHIVERVHFDDDCINKSVSLKFT